MHFPCRKISKVNGQLNPEARSTSSDEDAKPPPKPSVWHQELQAAWLAGDDPRYQDLQKACLAAEELACTKWDGFIPQDIMPAEWVSACFHSISYSNTIARCKPQTSPHRVRACSV